MDNLPTKAQDSIFYKIKKFFYRLFHGKNEESEEIQSIETNIEVENHKNEFHTELKKDVNENNAKNDIIQKVRDNPELIDNLSVERLDQLDELLDEKILNAKEENEKLRQKLQKLKQQLAQN